MRLGSDPEFFLLNKGKPKAICGLIGHDKWDPYQYPDMPQGFTVQEDNVAVEFGIPPAASAQEFIQHIKLIKKKFLQEHPHFTFSGMSCIVFPDKELSHPNAKIFGCEPDYNAWTRNVNPKPKSANPNLRSAGGHVHVETKLDPFTVGCAMDLYLGVPSLLMDLSGDSRRELYGDYGAMRVKPYGMEYRVLSNFWTFKDKYIKWVWDNTKLALEFVESKGNIEQHKDDIEWCFRKNDKTHAKYLVDTLNLEVV